MFREAERTMEDSTSKEYQWMSRDMIKYIAMVTMLLNHIGVIFTSRGTLRYEILKDIGFFTAITMCYFLVEGFYYTSSRERYGKRLLLFAVFSQLPYNFAFEGNPMEFQQVNVIGNLFLCFLLLGVCETVTESMAKAGFLIFLIFLSLFCDWAVFAPVFVLLFYHARKEGTRAALKRAYLEAVLFFGGYNLLTGVGNVPFLQNVLMTLGTMAGPALSGICILFFYSGKRTKFFARFSKYFFYIFYPAHLTLLGGLHLLNMIDK